MHDNDKSQDHTKSPCIAMAFQIFEQLSKMYELLGIGKTEADFREEILRPMLNEYIDPNSIEDAFENRSDLDNLDMMCLSCAYAVAGMASYEDGDHENAWLGISHAQYWMGFALGTGFSVGAVNSALSTRGKSGAARRDARFGPLREFARELATAKKYPSKRNAALSIKEPVFNKAKELGISLSHNQAERTLTTWLAGIQFSSKK